MTDPKQIAKDDWRVAGVGMSVSQRREVTVMLAEKNGEQVVHTPSI